MTKKKDVKKDVAPEIEKVENELIRYEFSNEELQKLGGDLSTLLEQVTRVEEEASSAAASFKSDIKTIRLTIYNVARWIREKYDMRKVDCYCYKDYRERKVYYWRVDKVELEVLIVEIISHDGHGLYGPVKVRDMKHHELQAELKLKFPPEVFDSGSDSEGGEEVTTE